MKVIENCPGEEQVLYALIQLTKDKNQVAMLLENYVQKYGFVSDAAGDAIKEYIASLD